jgi:hypothetical protein
MKCLGTFVASAALTAMALTVPLEAAESDYFQIRIVDEQTGRGVPLVELRTTNKISCWTDSNGIVAWNEPGLMDRDVYFTIQSPGYTFPGSGKTLKIARGGRVELKIKRLAVAERLYRVTGQGIYRDSLLTGHPVPLQAPVLNAMVMGQDTVRATIYRGKLFWLWGDTDRPNGPLGNFNTTAATSELPGRGGLDPALGVDLSYFTRPEGFVKQMIPWTKRMTWMHSLMVLRDPAGMERLVSYYEVIRKLGDPERAGLAVFNDEKREFDPLVEFPEVPKVSIDGNASVLRAGGRDYFYFKGLWPGGAVRVPADWKAVQDLASYEIFEAERDNGVWKRGAVPRKPGAPTHFTDVQTGKDIPVHCDGIEWNEYRKRWIALLQVDPGEVWYAEADSPTGPVVYAARVAVHGKYTFYWPASHPFFDQDGGRLVYFEGTYTESFSGNPVITPRYNYNQIMYRMALDDPRLFLPAPVYRLRDGRYLMREGVAAARAWNQVESVPFFALAPDRRRAGTVEVAGTFYAVPLAGQAPPQSAAGDWDCVTNDKMDFSLAIAAHDGSLRLDIDGEHFTEGAYRDGALHAELTSDGVTYHLAGSYSDGKLTGGWKEDGGGTFACRRPSTEAWRDSPALVSLYFYDGKYSTEPKAGAHPIARVWRNPAVSLMLDREAAAER